MKKQKTDKNCMFHVMNWNEAPPLSFVTAINDLPPGQRNAVRIGGGCANMSPQDVQAVETYFLKAFDGFSGVLFSGGTAKYNKATGEKSFMVTELPITIAGNNKDVKVLGSFPRTDTFRLAENEGKAPNLLFDDANIDTTQTHIQCADAGYNELLAVQYNVRQNLDWDGDLGVYFNLMDTWRQGGAKTCVITYNGGGVTYKEAIKAVEEGHKLIVINGSGRKSDELAAEFADDERVFIANVNDFETLREGLFWAGVLNLGEEAAS